ncbi:MAG: trypsin-like peptidase domain-containing protein [candidate division Zixibacteria bacterium]|nr:trypsin-like peptidase domain-containing protein [candidate division Zixibacteria bacterium]
MFSANRQFVVKHAALALALVIVSTSVLNAESALSTDDIREPYLYLLQASKHGDTTVCHGTGVFIYPYSSNDTLCLMTAHHNLRDRDKLELFHQGPNGTLEAVLDSAIDLNDNAGNPLFRTFQTDSTEVADFALLSFPKSCISTKRLRSLSRSFCLFGDSIKAGDHVVVFGFPELATFSFVRRGDFMAVSATVAYVDEAANAYLLDRKLHHGMSGGIVYKELPLDGCYGYKAAGLVLMRYQPYPDYSVIVNLNYIDSIYVRETGSPWGQPSTDTGEH